MTMKQILALGAPALPPGHFYRVGRIGLDGTLAVQIRRERRWGSTLVRAARLRLVSGFGNDVPVETAIERAAVEAFDSFDRDNELNNWIGDHK